MSSNQNASNRELWESRVAEWKTSGKSMSEWCSDHSIPPSSFSYWKLKFSSEKLNRNAFVEISEEKPTGIEIRCKGCEIYVEKDFDEQTLSRCLKIIGGFSC
jgi:transposase-like protein